MSRPRNAYAAPSWAAEQTVGDVGTKAVLLTLANYADENFSCFPGQGTIAAETEQSERTVRRQLELLRELGLIRRVARYDNRGKRTSDRYYLLLDETSTKDDVKAAKARILERKETGESLPEHDVTDSVHPSPALPANLSGSESGVTTGQIDATTGQTEGSLPDTGVRGTPRELPEVELPDSLPRPTAAAARDGSPTGSPKKGSRLPEDWTVTSALVEWARQKAPDVNGALETEKFKNYWLAKPGKDGVKLSWERTWQNWFITAQQRIEASGSKSRGYNDKATWGVRPVEVKPATVGPMSDEEAEAIFSGGRTDRPAPRAANG